MGSIQRYISSILLSLLMCPTVNASSVYLTSDQPFLFKDKSTYGMFIGSVDPIPGKQTYYADQQAAMIAMQFINYGATVMSTPGNTGESSAQIGASIINYANLVKDGTFKNSDTFVLYLTGHGSRSDIDKSKYGIQFGDPDETNNILSNYDLTDYLTYIPSDINKIVILDACLSGGFIKELKTLKNISILTSANSLSGTGYNKDGSLFGIQIAKFLHDQNGKGFTFDDMVDYVRFNFNYGNYYGMQAYELGPGDPMTLSPDDFTIQVYESPTYNPVPEPSTLLLLCAGFASISIIRKRKNLWF